MTEVKIESIDIPNGKKWPLIGLGTFRGDKENLGDAVKYAIKCGYRHFDCAWLYGNEDVVGKAIKDSIEQSNGLLKREDFFLVSKVWNTHHSRDLVRKQLNETLNNLCVDYLDLYLIHWPMGFKENTGNEPFPADENGKRLFSDVHYLETYHALEELYTEGKLKNIGVSNFNISQLQDILDNCKIKPINNQIELNPYFQNDKLVEFCHKNGIIVSCFAPIGSGQKTTNKPDLPVILENPTLIKIAKKYNKTPAQVCLRWGIQRNLVMLPKSCTPSRILENAQVFDFKLSDEDMREIKELDQKLRIYSVESLKHHKFYPFNSD